MVKGYADILRQLEHPNIPDILDASIDGEIPYVAEEFLTGDSLAKAIEKQRTTNTYLDENRTLMLIRQVLSALSHIHDKKIVHKDVNPYNVMVDNGTARLTDFDISEGLEDLVRPALKHTVVTQTLSGTETIDGFTLDYASPEQRARQPLDQRSDLYSAAMTLFEMLTNTVQRGSDVDPKVYNPLLKFEYAAFFERALKPRPQDRFQTAEEMSSALEQLAKPRIEKQEDEYGGGAIIHSALRGLYLTDANTTKSERIFHSGEENELRDFSISEDKKHALVLVRKPEHAATTFDVARIDLETKECVYLIKDSKQIEYPIAILLYENTLHIGKGENGTSRPSWYRWKVNEQRFEPLNVQWARGHNDSSPNGKYKLHTGTVNGTYGLYILPTTNSLEELPRLILAQAGGACEWIAPEETPKTQTAPSKKQGFWDQSLEELWKSLFRTKKK